jgi:hypothetical protein
MKKVFSTANTVKTPFEIGVIQLFPAISRFEIFVPALDRAKNISDLETLVYEKS